MDQYKKITDAARLRIGEGSLKFLVNWNSFNKRGMEAFKGGGLPGMAEYEFLESLCNEAADALDGLEEAINAFLLLNDPDMGNKVQVDDLAMPLREAAAAFNKLQYEKDSQ